MQCTKMLHVFIHEVSGTRTLYEKPGQIWRDDDNDHIMILTTTKTMTLG
jgi:hypothetical protein